MRECIFLIAVVERWTNKEIIAPVEWVTKFSYCIVENDPTSAIECYAKYRYIERIEKRMKYQPTLKQKLENKDWVVDCVLLEVK